MNTLQRWITHRKLDKLYNQLLDELGPVAKKDKPELVLDKRLKHRGDHYAWTFDSAVNEIRLPAKYIRDTGLAPEVGHATGLVGSRGNALTRSIIHNFGYCGAQSPVFNTVTQFAGLGELSALAHLIRLGEEGQASVRGLRALKKVRGELNGKEIADLAHSYSTYVQDSILKGLLVPKVVREGANLITDHGDKVLLDSLLDNFT